jgi:hypothetical protein
MCKKYDKKCVGVHFGRVFPQARLVTLLLIQKPVPGSEKTKHKNLAFILKDTEYQHHIFNFKLQCNAFVLVRV